MIMPIPEDEQPTWITARPLGSISTWFGYHIQLVSHQEKGIFLLNCLSQLNILLQAFGVYHFCNLLLEIFESHLQ